MYNYKSIRCFLLVWYWSRHLIRVSENRVLK